MGNFATEDLFLISSHELILDSVFIGRNYVMLHLFLKLECFRNLFDHYLIADYIVLYLITKGWELFMTTVVV